MKFSKYVIGFIGIALSCTLVYMTINFANTINPFSPISNDAIVSGIHIGVLNREQLVTKRGNPAAISVNLIEKNGLSDSIDASKFVENPLDSENFKIIIKNNFIKTNSFLSSNQLARKAINPTSLIYNKSSLDETVNSLQAFNTSTVPTTNANISYNIYSDLYEPVSESIGTEVDRPALVNNLINKLENAKDDQIQTIELEKEKVYKQPKFTLNSPVLNNWINQLNNQTDNTILTYEIGWRTYYIPSSIYGQWIRLNDKGQIYFDQNLLKNYFKDLSIGDYIFTSKEEAINLKTELTGYLINYATEAVEDRKALLNNEPVTRTLERFTVTIDDIAPIYTAENQERLNQLTTELGPEFVYINLAEQFMWYFKDNQLVVATPITSGTKYGHDTPTGRYEVQAKSMNVTLKGENDDGSKYESPVVYWVGFNGSIGIHDADNWRASYGTDVYLYNGSHGCVNTPRSKMKILYENITWDCPILVED